MNPQIHHSRHRVNIGTAHDIADLADRGKTHIIQVPDILDLCSQQLVKHGLGELRADQEHKHAVQIA